MIESEIEDTPPEWHRDYLKQREEAIAEGADSFISLDEFEEEFRDTDTFTSNRKSKDM